MKEILKIIKLPGENNKIKFSALKDNQMNKNLKRPKTGVVYNRNKKWKQIPVAVFPFGRKIIKHAQKQPKISNTQKIPEGINIEIKPIILKKKGQPSLNISKFTFSIYFQQFEGTIKDRIHIKY